MVVHDEKYFINLFGFSKEIDASNKNFIGSVDLSKLDGNAVYYNVNEVEMSQRTAATIVSKICAIVWESKEIRYGTRTLIGKIMMNTDSVLPYDQLDRSVTTFCKSIEKMLTRCHLKTKIEHIMRVVNLSDDPNCNDSNYEIDILVEVYRAGAKFYKL